MPAAFTIRWLVRLVYPLVWVSTRMTQVLGKSHKDEITREEILALASLGRKDGALKAQENEYLVNLLKLSDTQTSEILTPRTVVLCYVCTGRWYEKDESFRFKLRLNPKEEGCW